MAAGIGTPAGTAVVGDCNTCVHDDTAPSTCELLCLHTMAIGQTAAIMPADIKPAYDRTTPRFVPTLLIYPDLDPPRRAR